MALLAGEYQTRGLQAAPSELHAAATGIELERQPFGRLRVGMWAAKALKAMAGDIGGTFRRLEIEDPEWMRPSARATYLVDPVRAGGRWVGIDVDPDARPILIRAWTDGIHRIGPYVDVCLWLDDQPGDAPITVRLGEHPLGTLPPDAVAAFGPDLTAAYGLYDEAVRVTGRLYQAAPGDSPSLELRLPC